MNKFEFDAQEINYGARFMNSTGIEGIILRLEKQAIEILQKAGICSPAYYNPPYSNDLESWRGFWVNEAHHQCESFEPLGASGDHLEQGQRAAVNVLVAASALRSALMDGTHAQVASLSMVLISDAVIGGMALDLESTVDELSTLTAAKRIPYEKGLGKRQMLFNQLKTVAIEFAKAKWKLRSETLMTEMAELALDHIRSTMAKDFLAGDIPGIDTVKTWLRNAGKAGELLIPSEASRPGRRRLNK